MAKIIKLPPPKNPLEGQKVRAIFADYEPAENCCNDDGYVLCIKCEQCGRKFIDGILQKEGAD